MKGTRTPVFLRVLFCFLILLVEQLSQHCEHRWLPSARSPPAPRWSQGAERSSQLQGRVLPGWGPAADRREEGQQASLAERRLTQCRPALGPRPGPRSTAHLRLTSRGQRPAQGALSHPRTLPLMLQCLPRVSFPPSLAMCASQRGQPWGGGRSSKTTLNTENVRGPGSQASIPMPRLACTWLGGAAVQ